MKNIEQESKISDDTEYLDYKDIVIEVDEKILKFISSFNVGSFLSLEFLVELADKFECEKCWTVFYSKSFYIEHVETHHGYLPAKDISPVLFSETNTNEEQNIVMCDTEHESLKYEEEIVVDIKSDDVVENEDINPNSFKVNNDKRQMGYSDPLTADKTSLPFTCTVCEKTFARQSLLVWHNFSHPKLNQEEYPCFHCTNHYGGYGANKAKSSYKRHIERLINREKRTCDECGHMARTEEYLDIHTKTKHLGIKLFQCEFQGCESKFSKVAGLKKHKKLHDRSNIYPCSKCSWTTDFKQNLYRHIQRNHVDKSTLNLKCDQCIYEGVSKDSLLHHKRVYHSGKIHECLPCGKKYVDREKYLWHIKRDHEGVRHMCDYCDKRFTLKFTLDTHVKRDHIGLVLNCEKCDHKSTSQRALRKHILRTHEDDPYACKLCSYVASSNEYLSGHVNKVHKGIKYQCDLCEHISYVPYLLKLHMKEWHPEHAPDIFEHQKLSFDLENCLKCVPCNKLFDTDDKYRIHTKTHNNSTKKRVQKKRQTSNCNVCGTIIGNLKRHMRTKHHVNSMEQ